MFFKKHYLYIGLILASFLSIRLSAGQSQVKPPVFHCPIIKDTLTDPLIPRGRFLPRASFIGIPVLDTLETQTPGVKILIYSNNTWNFYRDPQDSTFKNLFERNWSNSEINPYKLDLKDLPDRIKLWIVDNPKDFVCPNPVKVYSPYGIRHGRRHNGVDLPLKRGTDVYAAFAGKVRFAKRYKGFGNLIILRHPSGIETFYAHLSKILVKPNEWVEPGQVIGLGGSTGHSTGPHLHFETRFRGHSFDPQWLIDFPAGRLRSNLFILKKKYMDRGSRYVPESIDEENEIHDNDTRDYAIAKEQHYKDSLKTVELERQAKMARYHRVRSGDSLYKIAKRYHTSVSAICRLNKGLTARTTLKLGRRIRVK